MSKSIGYLYTEKRASGEKVTIFSESKPSLGAYNNRIKSIVLPRYKGWNTWYTITFFEHENYQGRQFTLGNKIKCSETQIYVRRLDNLWGISSYRVQEYSDKKTCIIL